MLPIRNANFWKSIQFATKLPKNVASRSFQSTMCFVPRPGFKKEVLSCSCFPIRPFYTTGRLRLKTLFSETEQSKIINFVNKLNSKELLWAGKLRPLNKIAENLPSTGPITDINDLMERHALPTTSAVSLCKTILKSSGDPSDLLNIQSDTLEKKKLLVAKKNVSRKLTYLWRTVKPEVADSKSISSFTSIVIAENSIGYAIVEKQNDWNSQLLTDWSGFDISASSQSIAETILTLAKVLPGGEYFVIASLPSLSTPLNQWKLHGILLALLCAKNDFRDDLPQKIFEMNKRSAARHFNLVVGNEIVSSTNMVSDTISRPKMPDTDDHVYRRSLREMTFEEHAVEKFNASDDAVKEYLSQSLLVAKAFTEILKV